MRGYPLLLEKGAELCTAINISILHKFENTKHKHFGSVGRYMNGVVLYLLFGEFELAIVPIVSLNTQNILGVYYGY